MPRTLALCSGLLLAGCAAGAAPTTGSDPAVIYTGAGTYRAPVEAAEVTRGTAVAAPADRVLSVLPAVYQQLGLPVDLVDPPARTVGASAARLRRTLGDDMLSTFFDCGSSVGTVNANSHEVTASVVSQVEPAAAGSTLRVRVDASARPVATRGHAVSCTSTGRLERRIAEAVTRSLAG